jgi:hypothetical protein
MYQIMFNCRTPNLKIAIMFTVQPKNVLRDTNPEVHLHYKCGLFDAA